MNITETGEKALLEPYFYVPGYKTPRYYQRIAINRVMQKVDFAEVHRTKRHARNGFVAVRFAAALPVHLLLLAVR